MDMDEAVRSRHSVRQYTDRRIEGETLSRLQSEIDAINSESGLRIRLITDEPKAFGGVLMRSVVRFKGAVNYFAITGTDSDDLEERAGYYGERLVLYAQTLGLNTCWAMLAGRKESERRIDEGFEHVINIAVGYGENQGTPHKNRSVDSVADLADAPEWFSRGVEYAMMAPTGMNKQGFRFEREGDRVRMVTGTSKLAKIDRGIVRYHFELGAGKDSFSWMERGAPVSSEIGRIRSRACASSHGASPPERLDVSISTFRILDRASTTALAPSGSSKSPEVSAMMLRQSTPYSSQRVIRAPDAPAMPLIGSPGTKSIPAVSKSGFRRWSDTAPRSLGGPSFPST